METQRIRGEIAEFMLNSSITRLVRLAEDQNIKPLIQHFIRIKFGLSDMDALDSLQLKEVIDFVENFHSAARSGNPDA